MMFGPLNDITYHGKPSNHYDHRYCQVKQSDEYKLFHDYLILLYTTKFVLKCPWVLTETTG